MTHSMEIYALWLKTLYLSMTNNWIIFATTTAVDAAFCFIDFSSLAAHHINVVFFAAHIDSTCSLSSKPKRALSCFVSIKHSSQQKEFLKSTETTLRELKSWTLVSEWDNSNLRFCYVLFLLDFFRFRISGEVYEREKSKLIFLLVEEEFLFAFDKNRFRSLIVCVKPKAKCENRLV